MPTQIFNREAKLTGRPKWRTDHLAHTPPLANRFVFHADTHGMVYFTIGHSSPAFIVGDDTVDAETVETINDEGLEITGVARFCMTHANVEELREALNAYADSVKKANTR